MDKQQPVIMGAVRALRDFAEQSDEQVVTRVLAGETALFEVLMRRHNQRLYRLARGVLRDDGEAREAVHEAYIRAYDRLGSLRQRGSFGGWISRIVYRQALSHVQARRDAPGVSAESETADQASWDPERLTAVGELRRVLEQAIDRLPEASRVVFLLREVEGLKTGEVAGVLECSEEVVKVRLHRARAALRQHIDEQLGTATRDVFAFAGDSCDQLVHGVLRALAERAVRLAPGP